MDPFGPGDQDDCGDDPFCGWAYWPPPIIFPPIIDEPIPQIPAPPPPPTPIAIQNTTGVYAQGQWGSFPNDGEHLGLPSGMSIPGPLSPQVLLKLGPAWDCSSGLCLPGVSFAANQVDNIVSGYVPPQNAVTVYRQQALMYLKALALNALCPSTGPSSLIFRSMRNGAVKGAISGAIKGASGGAAAGTAFDGVGAVPGAVLGAAAGASTGMLTATGRIKACEALGAEGY